MWSAFPEREKTGGIPILLYVCHNLRLAEANFVCSARTIPRWKIQLESIPSVYSTFAAELIQPTFRQLTFSLLPYCSMGDYPEAMVEVRTGDALPNANEQF